MEISIIELFSGIGAQRKSLLNLGLEVNVVGISEIDKYAIQSYEAIFGKTKNYGDICTATRLDYADIWTYSFPCQDISVAGNQKGINENTRSGLLYQVQRLLEVAKEEGTLPKYLLLENVKNLVGKKFKSQFDEWIKYLDELGYDTYWQVLNAKNYGIPQNRERVFAVSIRKDLNETFEFPKAEPLTKKLADVLEDEVDEKYYLDKEKVNRFLSKGNVNPSGKGMNGNVCLSDICNTLTTNKGEGLKIIEPICAASRGRNLEKPSDRTVGAPTQQRLELNLQGVSNTITTVQKDNYVVENRIIQVGNIVNTGNWNNPQRGRIYSTEGLSPALNTVAGGGLEPKIIIDDTQSFDGVRAYENYAPTLRASRSGLKTTDGIIIRKLTPLECWRLMGFDDEDFHKAKASGVSNSQLYKQAGNSIVVNVLEKIFENLLIKG